MLVGAMGALLPEDMQRMNAAKNLLSLLVNIVAAVAYTWSHSTGSAGRQRD